MIVLDASALIAWAETADAHNGAAVDVLAELAEESFAASVLTLAEFLVRPAREGQIDAALERLAVHLDVHRIALPPDADVRLAMLRAETGLKLPDCGVLLATEQQRAGLLSFDDRLRTAARHRGLRVIGV